MAFRGAVAFVPHGFHMNEQIPSSINITPHTTKVLRLKSKTPNPYPKLCSQHSQGQSSNDVMCEASSQLQFYHSSHCLCMNMPICYTWLVPMFLVCLMMSLPFLCFSIRTDMLAASKLLQFGHRASQFAAPCGVSTPMWRWPMTSPSKFQGTSSVALHASVSHGVLCDVQSGAAASYLYVSVFLSVLVLLSHQTASVALRWGQATQHRTTSHDAVKSGCWSVRVAWTRRSWHLGG